MYCRHCGQQIPDDSTSCTGCGRPTRRTFASFFENSEITRLKPASNEKSPGLAAFLGFCLSWLFLGPLGYLYLGQWNWCWITLVITIVAYPLTFGLAYLLFPFLFAFHQYQMAKELNSSLSPTPSSAGPGDGSFAGGGASGRFGRADGGAGREDSDSAGVKDDPLPPNEIG